MCRTNLGYGTVSTAPCPRQGCSATLLLLTVTAEVADDQIVTVERQSPLFVLQVDEPTQTRDEPRLLCFVRYELEHGVLVQRNLADTV
jgi:hypothetical protein